MSQAPNYVRTTDFYGDELNNRGGRSTVETADVNAEFDAVGTSINAINANIALNQRDDGEIRDQRVKLFTLSPEVLKLVTAFGGTIRGAWTTATLYAIKDVVTQGGNTYVAAVAHTSGVFATDLAAVRWVLVQLGSATAAAGVPFTPTGTLAATNVQAAIDEADTENRALTAAEAAARSAADSLILNRLADLISSANAAGMVGLGILPYNASTVGGALFTTVWGAGVTDRAAQLTAANALGLPIRIIGACTVNSPVTITVPIVDTMAQIFATTAQITINNGLPVRPEWFGSAAGNIRLAVNAQASGVVRLENKTYPPSYDTGTPAMFANRSGTPGLDYMVKPHIAIIGAKLPEYTATNDQLVNGTVIQGTFYVASECIGFEMDMVGVDAGSVVVNALYGGADHDGLCILQANKAGPVQGSNVRIGRVRGLCKGTGAGGHAVLFESITGLAIERAEGRGATHGVVIKCREVDATSLVGSWNTGEDVLVKSDSYALSENVKIANVSSSTLNAATEVGAGFQIQAGTASVGSVQVGNLYTSKKDWVAVIVALPTFLVVDVNIANIIGQSCTAGGVQLSGDVRRFKGGVVTINATPVGLYVTSTTTDRSNYIGELSVTNATYGIEVGGKIAIGRGYFSNAGKAIQYDNSTAQVYAEDIVLDSGTVFSNLSVPLAGTWAQNAGGDTFGITIKNGRWFAYGLISGGGTGTVVTSLPTNMRPPQNIRMPLIAYTGVAYGIAEGDVLVAGGMGIANVAVATGAGSYLSMNGLSWPINF